MRKTVVTFMVEKKLLKEASSEMQKINREYILAKTTIRNIVNEITEGYGWIAFEYLLQNLEF